MKKRTKIFLSILLSASMIMSSFTVYAEEDYETEVVSSETNNTSLDKDSEVDASANENTPVDENAEDANLESTELSNPEEENVSENTDFLPMAETIVASGTCGDNLTWELDVNGMLTISGTGKMDCYESSCSPWYTYRTTINSVKVGNGVASIGDYAFYYCSNLKDISFSDGLTSIGIGAFSGCSSLNNITLPDSLTSISESAFSSSGLIYITIPDTVTCIPRSAFYNCRQLTNVVIPDSVTSIEKYAFRWCSNLKSITIPAGVINLGEEIFNCCSSLTEIIVDENNTVFDSRDNCNAVIETESNTLVFGCDYSVIPNSVTTIGSYAFCGSDITDITIPDSVTNIESYAFSGCTYLTSVTLPESVTSTGYFSFNNCSKMKNAVVMNPNLDLEDSGLGLTLSYASFDFVPINGFVLYCLPSSKALQYAQNHSIPYSIIGLQVDAPVLKSVSNTTDGITLEWSGVACTGYQIYRSTDGTNFTKLKTLGSTCTSYIDTKTSSNGQKYWYKIRAYDANGGSTARSSFSSVKSVYRSAPATLSSVKNSSSGIAVTWKKVSGASGYFVYRSAGTGSYKRIATIKSGSTVTYKDTEPAVAGKSYSYKIQAYVKADGNVYKSTYSSVKKTYLLAKPVISSVSAISSGVQIKWGKVSKATGYLVYRSVNGGSYKQIKKITSGSTVKYTDTGATKKGNKYSYKIYAYITVNGTSYLSCVSTAKSVKK